MGLANSTYGFGYTAVLVTAPQLLAARGVAEPVIAGMTTLALSSSLLVFVVAPILDTLISRRAWSIGLGLVGAALTTLVLTLPPTSHLLGVALAADALALSLYNSAIGGWLGAVLPKSCDETIGTWFTIGNAGGFGLGALTQYWLLTHTPAGLGSEAIGVATLIPLAVLRVVPAVDVGRKAVHESFRNLARDVVQLVRQPLILRIMAMFILPCAAFTLTNAFGGMGPDFHADNNLVSVANGIGAVVTGVLASILARLILKWISAPFLYLAIGSLGAAFTLSLLALTHSPATYLLAVLGENAAQGVAQVAQNAIIFRSIRQGSPLASSQFGLLSTAFVLPYAYMQGLDGFGYKLAGGVTGSFMMDALVSLGACVLLFWPVLRWTATGKLEATGETAATDDDNALPAVT